MRCWRRRRRKSSQAAQDQATADRFVSGFGNPEGMLAMFAPEPAAC
jgi:hypothetical protein